MGIAEDYGAVLGNVLGMLRISQVSKDARALAAKRSKHGLVCTAELTLKNQAP